MTQDDVDTRSREGLHNAERNELVELPRRAGCWRRWSRSASRGREPQQWPLQPQGPRPALLPQEPSSPLRSSLGGGHAERAPHASAETAPHTPLGRSDVTAQSRSPSPQGCDDAHRAAGALSSCLGLAGAVGNAVDEALRREVEIGVLVSRSGGGSEVYYEAMHPPEEASDSMRANPWPPCTRAARTAKSPGPSFAGSRTHHLREGNRSSAPATPLVLG